VQSTVTIGDYESVDTWEITQRYRVFFRLHRTLKSTYKLRISWPPKQLALFSAEKFERRFLETRRVALNTYLNEILAHPAASHSNYVLAFLDVPNNVSEWKSVWKRMKERDTESFIFNSSPRKKRSARSGGDNNNGINNNINNNNNISNKEEKIIEKATKETEIETEIQEFDEDSVQPSIINKYLNRLYFAIITGCLLGYGDIYPITNYSKFLASMQGLLTVILIIY
jgi:hypothetical protein